MTVASGAVPPLRSLPSYLDRIGLGAEPAPGLAEIHRAHATAIAVRELRPPRGHSRSPSISGTSRTRWSTRGRGGYCFEHNLLLAGGARVPRRLRGRPDARPGPPRPGGLAPPAQPPPAPGDGPRGTWLADVGFGGGGLLGPAPLRGRRRDRTVGLALSPRRGRAELVLQVFQDGGWTDMYGFVPEPAEPIDIAVNNWYTATHPDSDFVKGIIVGRRRPSAVFRCSSSTRPYWWSGRSAARRPSPRCALRRRAGAPGRALRDPGRRARATTATSRWHEPTASSTRRRSAHAQVASAASAGRAMM